MLIATRAFLRIFPRSCLDPAIATAQTRSQRFISSSNPLRLPRGCYSPRRENTIPVMKTQIFTSDPPVSLPAKPQTPSDLLATPKNSQDAIQPSEDFLSFTSPTFNFASLVNKSETLKKFVELGVDLSKLEKKKGIAPFVMKLDFDRDVKKVLFFLHDLGLPAEVFGEFLTKNPLIFKEKVEDLETRVYYLRSKNFTLENVKDIVARNPHWLSFSTKRIDKRLGWFQKNFNLTGSDVRFLTVKQPRLITYNLEHVREANFTIKEEMGFDENQTKVLLLAKPKYWMNDPKHLVERFDYVHNVMKISHERILQSPEVLSLRLHRLKQRYEFLKILGMAQFDETKPGYIPLKSLVEGSELEFVLNVCKSTPETYDNFLKTL